MANRKITKRHRDWEYALLTGGRYKSMIVQRFSNKDTMYREYYKLADQGWDVTMMSPAEG